MRLLVVIILLLLPSVSGAVLLTGKVVWEGEKRIDEKVRVEPGAELVVKPGTTVIFTAGGLEVAGRMSARGAVFKGKKWEGIVLKGCTLATLLTESEVSGAKIGIQVIGGEPRLEQLTLVGNDVGIELRQKSDATVAGSVFKQNRKVGLFLKDGVKAAVLNNKFEENGRYGAYIFRSTPRRFSGNVFSRHDTGLMVAYSGSDPELRDNCFDQNKVALRVEKAARPRITGSDISNNEVGISLYRRADPVIENNLLANNETGIEIAFSSYPEIRHNDFVDNGKALYLEFQSSNWEKTKGASTRQATSSRSAFGSLDKSSTELPPPRSMDGTVDARDNWWGKAGTAELEKIGADGNPGFIDDGRDRPTFVEEGQDYPLDTVIFSPWLQQSSLQGKEKE
ncbi:MAG: hypothetical protein C0615_04635 [Desulfuromonas sp.]|nr:MAG: hypothetical protein C0615_04635 [Desulfuromonas sp.]